MVLEETRLVDEVVCGIVDGDGASTVVDTGTLVDGSVSIGAASVVCVVERRLRREMSRGRWSV